MGTNALIIIALGLLGGCGDKDSTPDDSGDTGDSGEPITEVVVTWNIESSAHTPITDGWQYGSYSAVAATDGVSTWWGLGSFAQNENSGRLDFFNADTTGELVDGDQILIAPGSTEGAFLGINGNVIGGDMFCFSEQGVSGIGGVSQGGALHCLSLVDLMGLTGMEVLADFATITVTGEDESGWLGSAFEEDGDGNLQVGYGNGSSAPTGLAYSNWRRSGGELTVGDADFTWTPCPAASCSYAFAVNEEGVLGSFNVINQRSGSLTTFSTPDMAQLGTNSDIDGYFGTTIGELFASGSVGDGSVLIIDESGTEVGAIVSDDSNGLFGYTVQGFEFDGYRLLAVGDPSYDNGEWESGAVWLFDVSNPELLPTTTDDAVALWSSSYYDNCGAALDSVAGHDGALYMSMGCRNPDTTVGHGGELLVVSYTVE